MLVNSVRAMEPTSPPILSMMFKMSLSGPLIGHLNSVFWLDAGRNIFMTGERIRVNSTLLHKVAFSIIPCRVNGVNSKLNLIST